MRHVGNALFLMKAYAKGDAALEKRVDCFAHAQMKYILGFVTGARASAAAAQHTQSVSAL